MFTSYRQKLASFSDFSGIQRNFEIGFRCLVLLEKISFDKIFEADRVLLCRASNGEGV